jgi:hypothetical protein
VLPHRRVHRGRDEDGRVAGEVSGRDEIVGDAARELGDDVGGGGRDDEQIDRLREGDVRDGIGVVGRVVVDDDVLAGEVIATRTRQPARCKPRSTSAAL